MKILQTFLLACIILIIACQSLFSQMEEFFYLQSNFETTADQTSWQSVRIGISSKDWIFKKGGGDDYNPPIAAQGSKNALLYDRNATKKQTMLISPELELGDAAKPILRFHHAMYASTWGSDEMKLLFRPDPSSQWDTIVSYSGNIDDWYERVFDISALGSKYLTDHFQLAFLGKYGSGFGICIDSVVVSETEPMDKFIKSSKLEYVSHKAIPAGADDFPVERITLKVFGNTGNAILNSISVVPVGEGISSLEPSEFKLYKTSDIFFRTKESGSSTLIATGSLIDGQVVFSGLNKNLNLGNNYLWITVSAKDNLTKSSTVGFQFNPHSISMNDTLFPEDVKYADYYQKLNEVAYFQSFENISGWTLNNDFEAAVPLGKKVGNYYDPDLAYSGNKILGTDLTVDGAYRTGITSANAYFAIMPELDLTYYIKLGLFMNRQFHFGAGTEAVIQATKDGGANWHTLWTSLSDHLTETQWGDMLVNLHDTLASKKDQFQVRIGILYNSTDNYPGFNIDNFSIVGNHLDTDIGVTEVISPYNDCAGCGNDTVIAVFRNYAEGTSPSMIPVYYSINGSERIYDTIYGGIPQDGSITFKFSQLAPFPQGDIYDEFIVGVDLEEDEDSRNDTLTKPLILQNTNLPPHLNDFEFKGGLWQRNPGATWQCLDMSLSIPTNPESPNIWVLSPTGTYGSNDDSWVESECYDLTQSSRHIIELEYWSQTEASIDGARMEYTINDGATWTPIDGPAYASVWGWYTQPVSSLGTNGWSGSHNWTTAKAFVPETAEGHSKVKFRIRFASDNATSFPLGFAFNDFQVYPAPPDVGVSSIVQPVNACQYVNSDTVDVMVTNYGFNRINSGEVISVGVDFESEAPVIFNHTLTSNLLPGQSRLVSVPVQMDIDAPGTYDITAYTLGEDDPYFYTTNNDTLSTSFSVWANPLTLLPDSMYSRSPDTLYIQPYNGGGYTYLWHDGTTAQTYDVDWEGYHWVTVTEPVHGCKTTDTVVVVLLFNDVGIRSLVSPVSTCELSANEVVQVEFANMGTDSLLAGEEITLYYRVDGGATYDDVITLPYNLHAGASIIHSFDDTYDFSAIKSYTLDAWSYYGGDTVAGNNELHRTFTVYGYTPLDLGADKTVAGLSTTLDAGPNFDTYLWSTGATTQSVAINQSGQYWVHATDDNACPGDDTLFVWFKIRDVLPDSLVAPLSSCDRSGNEQVSMRILNNGTDTIGTGDLITVSYQVGSGAVVQESFNPAGIILPGGQYNYTFGTTVDVSAFQTHTFNLTATTTGDLVPANNNYSKGVVTQAKPVVNLGTDRVITTSSTTLDAGEGAGYTYLWNNGSTFSTLRADTTGTYSCTVTNSITGCYASDAVFLTFNVKDIAVQSYILPFSGCTGYKTNVKVVLKNNGTYTLPGMALTVGFQLNEETPVEQYFEKTIAGGWENGELDTLILSDTINITRVGSNTVTVYIEQETEDERPGNDLVDFGTFEVAEAPLDDWRGKTIHVEEGFPYQLDAGAGYSLVQWSDNTIGRYFTVQFPAEYTAVVYGGNPNCYTQKSINVLGPNAIDNVTAKNLKVELYPNPAKDFLKINASLLTGEEFTIELIDVANHVVWSEKHKGYDTYENTLDVKNLSAGIYFIRFSNSEIYRVDKIIVY